MLTFFCPVCWRELKGDLKMCPFCGSDIREFEKRGFEEKLVNALRHPERETVERAVYILGELKSVKAVNPLIELFNMMEDNPFLRISVLKALYEIGIPEAVEFIARAAHINAGIVGKEAERLLGEKEK